jgi:hypothetical protein
MVAAIKSERWPPSSWNRWPGCVGIRSYYDELLKSRRFAKAAEQHPDFYEVIVEKIKSGEIERAVDIRDRLPLIVEAGGNTLKRFVQGKIDFEHSVADAKDRGAGDYTARKLRDFRTWLAEDQVAREVSNAGELEKKGFKYELSRIERRVKQILGMIE